MLQIENDRLKVSIAEKGAQLTHVENKQQAFDYIWNGTAWPKHAPLLFPAIGRSTEDSYLVAGKTYPMQQHGFASDYEFTIVEHLTDKLVLRLTDNAETLQSYPFHFALIVTFELVGNELKQVFAIKNLNEAELSCSFGFHPAFNVPINAEGAFEDYQLTFETTDTKLEQFLIKKNPFPYRSGAKLEFNQSATVLPLTRELFADGLIILDNHMQTVTLSSVKTERQVKMELADFPYFCLWTKEDEDLGFICLEPFYGLPDILDQKQELKQKEGNLHIAPQAQKDLTCNLHFL